MSAYDLTHLRDDVLLRGLDSLAAQDRTTTAQLIAHIAEVDHRRLYAPAGYASMHVYCVEKLHLSESAAFRRIQVARAARTYAQVYLALEQGRVHLSGLMLLAPHLRPENVEVLLEASTHRRKAQIERMLVEAFPAPEPLRLDDGVCALAPERVSVGANDPIARPAAVAPREEPAKIAPVMARRFSIQVTIDEETHGLLRRAQELSPGDVAGVLRLSLQEFVARREMTKAALTDTPRTPRPSERARTIPAHVRRAVWKRDEGRCTYTGEDRHRCESRVRSEFDHVIPVARGGESTVENVRLLCHTHNRLEAEREFGRDFMEARRSEQRGGAVDAEHVPEPV